MATWITHLMIADGVMKQCSALDRHGFCVGNIAPDCNVENEDWTSFTPPREVTHWMSGEKKVAADCDAFYEEYLVNRKEQIRSEEQYAFYVGYYTHLITDAAWQALIRDEQRVQDVWSRIDADQELSERAKGAPRNWDTVKKLISKRQRLEEISWMEAEYLRDHPDSGFLTEIVPLKDFPDYIDYLPHGCIVRKMKYMAYIPSINENLTNPIGLSREELKAFVDHTVKLVIDQLKEKRLM